MAATLDSSSPLIPRLPSSSLTLFDAKARVGLTFAQLGEALGRDEVAVAALFYGQAQASEGDITKLSETLGIEHGLLTRQLSGFPDRGHMVDLPPKEPLIYRLFEIVQNYGYAYKAVLNEKFGDGIMSAISFTTKVDKEVDEQGTWAVITLRGKCGWSSPEEAEGERLLHNGGNDEEAIAAMSALVADELPLLNDNRRAGGGRNLPSWSWRQRLVNMTMRKRRKLDGRLGAAGSAVTSEKPRRKRWRIVRWCCMGGFGGLVVLALVVLVSLMMGLATLVWAGDIQQVIADWGKPGKKGEGLSWWPTSFSRDITPIPCHSHNDYWRRVPLYSALRVGCISVEADVWLFDNDLYVGHDTSALTRNRTLSSLYINPLVDILTKQNPSTEFANNTRNGVFDTDPGMSLTLLIDVKTDGQETWPHVIAQLEPLRKRNWLTAFNRGAIIPGPVTVVGTGNTPFSLVIANDTYRDYFFDAPLTDMWEDPDPETPSGWDGEATPGVVIASEANAAEDEKLADRPFQPSLPPPRRQSARDNGEPPTASHAYIYNSSNSYYASASLNDAVGRIWHGHLNGRQIDIIRGQLRGAHRRGLKARYWDLPSWPIGKRNRIWKILIAEDVDILNVDDLRGASKGWWG